jgi:hypothetical protein
MITAMPQFVRIMTWPPRLDSEERAPPENQYRPIFQQRLPRWNQQPVFIFQYPFSNFKSTFDYRTFLRLQSLCSPCILRNRFVLFECQCSFPNPGFKDLCVCRRGRKTTRCASSIARAGTHTNAVRRFLPHELNFLLSLLPQSYFQASCPKPATRSPDASLHLDRRTRLAS